MNWYTKLDKTAQALARQPQPNRQQQPMRVPIRRRLQDQSTQVGPFVGQPPPGTQLQAPNRQMGRYYGQPGGGQWMQPNALPPGYVNIPGQSPPQGQFAGPAGQRMLGGPQGNGNGNGNGNGGEQAFPASNPAQPAGPKGNMWQDFLRGIRNGTMQGQCPHCKARIGPAFNFCANCGSALHPDVQTRQRLF